MNSFCPPADPEDTNRQLSSATVSPPSFPPPAKPDVDIGERVAVQKALQVLTARASGSSPTVIRCSQIIYGELGKFEPKLVELAALTCREAKLRIYVVELEGIFTSTGMSRPHGARAPGPFTKAYILVRAADGRCFGQSYCPK